MGEQLRISAETVECEPLARKNNGYIENRGSLLNLEFIKIGNHWREDGMFSKVITYGRAFGIITKNMIFWSPSTYHKSQRFVGEMIQYDLVNKYACPNLKQIPIADLFDHFDIESIKLKEFKG
ncbi:MAG: hypothetical protein NTY64_14440, partial [Deltaproteobacteria bacterium]|nr:hypothetical protein [Deltaproteobacteria bacterium]